MLLATFGLNIGLVVLFAVLLVTLVLLALADLFGGPEAGGTTLFIAQLGGYAGLLTALAAWYVMGAVVINETLGRAILPVGELGG